MHRTLKCGQRADLVSHVYQQNPKGRPVWYYIGDWLKTQPHGRGLLVKDNYCYEGDFSHGWQHGEGIRTWTLSGIVETGTFVNGVFVKGSHHYPDGRWFEGKFDFNRQTSFGTLYFVNGATTTGSFVNGSRVGCMTTQLPFSCGTLRARYVDGERKGSALFHWDGNGDWWYGDYINHHLAFGVKRLVVPLGLDTSNKGLRNSGATSAEGAEGAGPKVLVPRHEGGMIVGFWRDFDLRNGVGTMIFVPLGSTTDNARWGTVTANVFFPLMIQ